MQISISTQDSKTSLSLKLLRTILKSISQKRWYLMVSFFFEWDNVFPLLFSQSILKQKLSISYSLPSENSRTSQRSSNVTQYILLHGQASWSKDSSPSETGAQWKSTKVKLHILPVRESKTHTTLHARLCNTCVLNVTPFCLLDGLKDIHLLPAVWELPLSPNWLCCSWI